MTLKVCFNGKSTPFEGMRVLGRCKMTVCDGRIVWRDNETGFLKLYSTRPIAKNTYEMKLAGDAFATTAAGQFVNIKLDGFFLRRPFSVSDFDKDITF